MRGFCLQPAACWACASRVGATGTRALTRPREATARRLFLMGGPVWNSVLLAEPVSKGRHVPRSPETESCCQGYPVRGLGLWALPRAGRTVLPASSPGFSFQMAEQLMTLAYDNGINLFDTAEVYAAGKYVSLLVGKSGAATALRGGFPHAPPPLPTFLNSQRLQDVLFPWDWSRRTGTPVTCKLPTVHTPR